MSEFPLHQAEDHHRADIIREIALDHALSLQVGGDPASIVEAARIFEVYLSGEEPKAS